jgi:hypothetical protein
MSYKYLNPRTRKHAETSDWCERAIELLLADKEKDIILVTSSYSMTFKMCKWHFEEYARDWEGPELIAECPISILKNYLSL